MTGKDEEAKEAFEMLEEIHDTVVSGDFDFQNSPDDMPRWTPGPDTKFYKILAVIRDKGPIDISGVQKQLGSDRITKQLSDLWHVGYVNRRSDGSNNYVYTGVTDWGEEVLQMGENESGDVELKNGEVEREIPEHEKASMGRRQYEVLKGVAEYEGHPRSSDLAEYLDLTIPRVSPQLSTLHEKGLLDRPDEQPYVYWITDKGRGKLVG
jgi:DNA-binding MarR family transcriptional regulator